MRPDTTFQGDDLRRTDPKFQQPRFNQYLAAVDRLDQLAHARFGKRVLHLAVRWMLDQGVSVALWGARRPTQIQAVNEVTGWRLDAPGRAKAALSSGCKPHPATAPAGSNRSSHGGNEMAGAFGVAGHI
jgi:aryl-alcohol dehydrogenase-like predicted oxidoreductase